MFPLQNEKKVVSMAKKSGGPNKSQAIRDYYKVHPMAKPKEVVAALGVQGIDVTPAFVSTIKSTSKAAIAEGTSDAGSPAVTGRAQSKRVTKSRKGPRKSSRAKTVRAAARATAPRAGADLSIDGLLKAKGVADQLGGVDKAIKLFEGLKKLGV